MSPLETTQAAVWAMDADEAGRDGLTGRPPANEDGTPHETLADQTVRLRQLLSVLETQYSGDTVLLIFPDGTGPALLTCLIGGIPLRRVHELEYNPGEVRLDINYKNARKQLSKEPSDVYMNKLEVGRERLKVLRENPEEVLNVRDQAYADEQLERTKKEQLEAMRKEDARKLELERKEKERSQKLQIEEKLKKERQLKDASEEEGKKLEKTNKVEDSSPVGAIAASTAVATVWATSLFSNNDDDLKVTDQTNATTQEHNVQKQTSNSTTIEDDIYGINEVQIDAKGGEADIANQSSSKNVEENRNSDTALPDESKQDHNYNGENDEGVENNSTNSLQTPVEEEKLKITTPSEITTADIVTPGVMSKVVAAWDPNEDDGSEAWLGSLAEMLEDDIE